MELYEMTRYFRIAKDIGKFKMSYNSSSPRGRELERGEFHPHPSINSGQALNPLPSRARNFIPDYVANYNRE